MEKETLRDRFYAITHLTWDVEALIKDVKEHGTAEEKAELLKKITWMIPDGAGRDKNPELAARDAAFVEEVAGELGIDTLSTVFVDFDKDGDVDGYDAITAIEETGSEGSGSF